LPVARREPVDRQHDAVAVAGECALIDPAARLGVGVEAFGDKRVHEPCALARAGQDSMAEDRRRRGPASERAAEPAAEIPHRDFADPLRALRRPAGKTRLPLDSGEGNPMLEQKAVADRSRRLRGDAFLIRRRRVGNADRAGDNVVPAIGRLDNNGARVGG
jgi:hypothetical protein